MARVSDGCATLQRFAALGKGVLPRGIENDNFHAAWQRRQRLRKIRHAHRLQRHVDVARQIGIDRHKIILAGELHTKAGEINDDDRIGSGRCYLAEKLAKRFSQRGLIEIARSGDGKARGRERLSHQAGVVGRRR